MATVRELSDPYGNFMLNPQPRGEGVCEVCSTFTRSPFTRCIPCAREVPASADAVLPISYSVHGSQLHRALAGYKRLSGHAARQFQLQISAVLWRFLALEGHEDCLASAAGVEAFETVTTVPSSSRLRDVNHPLRQMVGAGAVGILVIGRHVHEDFADNKDRLRALPRPFDWATCWSQS